MKQFEVRAEQPPTRFKIHQKQFIKTIIPSRATFFIFSSLFSILFFFFFRMSRSREKKKVTSEIIRRVFFPPALIESKSSLNLVSASSRSSSEIKNYFLENSRIRTHDFLLGWWKPPFMLIIVPLRVKHERLHILSLL